MKRNSYIDILKTISVIFVLLYHLNIIEAGFLAVCIFFTISGFLFSKSMNNENFNLKKYYLKKIKSLYLPLIIVIFITIFVMRYLVSVPWISIKQESLSAIFGYHNFFQIESNSDYFTRTDQSPFTHLWFISILLQLELILPLLSLLFKKIKDKRILLSFVTLLSIILFILIDIKYGIEVSYYHTFSRMFSFFIGCLAYHLNIKHNKPSILYIILIFFIILIGCFKNATDHYILLMIIVSILSGIYLLISKNSQPFENKLTKYICDISYLIYLIQFPVIYIINDLSNLSIIENIIIEIIVIIVLSIFMNYILSVNKQSSLIKKILYILIIILTISGIYGYITCPDLQKQMEELKEQLAINEKELLKKQEEYLKNLQSKKKDFDDNLEEINKALENLDQTVKDTQLVFIGDSVMLGGSYKMDEVFNNYYCDARGSRGGFECSDVLKSLQDKGVVGDYIIIHLGTNWGLEKDEVEEINNIVPSKKIFWLNVTNSWRTSENPMLKEYCDSHENNYLIDWYTFSQANKQYLKADNIHLTQDGWIVYDYFILENIKPVIKEELLQKKIQLETKYKEELNKRISIYGNDILLDLKDENLFNLFMISDNSFDSLYDQIKADIDNNILTDNIIIILNNSFIFEDNQLTSLISLISNRNYHLYAYGIKDNDRCINLEKIIKKEHLSLDEKHLNEKGKQLLLDIISFNTIR